MPACDAESTQLDDCNQKGTNLMDDNDGNSVPEDDDDEEEDVDFNPFLKETSSPEASSSLSSDDEGVGVSVVDNAGLSPASAGCRNKVVGEEIGIQTQISQSENSLIGTSRKRKAFSTPGDCRGGNDEFVKQGISADSLHPIRDTMDLDDDEEDAICRRTRARYSLANFSLDELENFLQETDDEDLQNVDDEQEYRKFLAAVLHGEENEDQSLHENGNADDDDDDEDSDADFEIEIEEALDSDFDENIQSSKNRVPRAGCRPKPQQINHNNKSLGQANRALRPLVPLMPNGLFPPSLGLDLPRPLPLPNSFEHSMPSSQPSPATGFTPHQVGQLHCLIHEHIQLLVQVFSLCVLDPSRQQIADDTRRLMSELVNKRNKALSWRKIPYPDFCFRPPYIHPSVPVSQSTSFGGPCNDGGTTKDSLWVPQIRGPMLSILDAAPLSLVGSYLDDVSRAVKEYKKRHVEALYDGQSEKRSLFPLFNVPTSPEEDREAWRGSTSQGPTTGSPSINTHQPPKKSLAASLVESTKKQSIAFVPKEIVAAVQIFYPLFNSALYPHKPPHAAVANRVLFTDTEDELLAMGMMEYNTDWKTIQQRFLPCKSKHQIFVRQKNRCSSKAPDNPIKAVRRLKTSPLNAEEVACIHKGLKVFRLDWTSVWKFLVPYRDPSLLPRQWRIALGTQKSYKSDAAKKEKRQLYELRRRLGKAATLANWQTASEKEDNLENNNAEGNNSENDNMEDEDEAYVHEAFLADWRPGNSKFMSSELPLSSLDRRQPQPVMSSPREDSYASKRPASDLYGGVHSNNHDFISLNPPHLQNVSQFTHVRYSTAYTTPPNHFSPVYLSNSSNSQVTLRPKRAPRKKDAQLVKLSPELPPVNLPPSVRVISHSAFKSYQCVTSHSTKISSCRTGTENLVPRSVHGAKSGMTVSVNSKNKGSTSSQSAANLCPEDPRIHSDQFSTEDNSADTDLQMHPLLLQAPEGGPLPYCPTNSSACAPNTFNFIAGTQLQANFSHFSKPSVAGSTVNGFYTSLSSKSPSKSCAIDFHPLLQRKDDADFAQLRISSDSAMNEPHVTSGTQTTTPVAASPKEMANELDLEIHLCSTSRKEKVKSDRKVAERDYNGSRNNLLNFGIIKETNKANKSSKDGSPPTASLAASPSDHHHLSRDHTLVLSNNISRMGDYAEDRSLPEIVMEKEELSDSEEENGEEVEFECEEMDDSEREESDCG